MTASPQRGLALDLDGTLLDSMRFHAPAWQMAFAEFGLSAPLDWFLLWEGINGPNVVRLALANLQADLTDEARKRLIERKQDHYQALFQPLPLPGLDTLRNTLERLNYPVAVVTGSENHIARRVLASIGFDSVVNQVVGGDDVVNGKPAPDPYLKAAADLRLPKADHCLVLENAPQGIHSARAAGMPCIAVETTLPREQLTAASRILPGLEAFATFLLEEHARSGGSGIWQL